MPHMKRLHQWRENIPSNKQEVIINALTIRVPRPEDMNMTPFLRSKPHPRILTHLAIMPISVTSPLGRKGFPGPSTPLFQPHRLPLFECLV